jgi:hypothetical protein
VRPGRRLDGAANGRLRPGVPEPARCDLHPFEMALETGHAPVLEAHRFEQ